jgi:hypothetical protein
LRQGHGERQPAQECQDSAARNSADGPNHILKPIGIHDLYVSKIGAKTNAILQQLTPIGTGLSRNPVDSGVNGLPISTADGRDGLTGW